MTKNDCPDCGTVIDEPYPQHRRWRCPATTHRSDIRDACQAAGLPRDAALWLLLDTVSKQAVAANRRLIVSKIREMVDDMYSGWDTTYSAEEGVSVKKLTEWLLEQEK